MAAGDSTYRGEWPPRGDDLPRAGRCVVYLAFDASGRILYVGKTDDFARRMRQHIEKSAWPEVCATWSCIDYGPDRATMDREEVELIRTLTPPFNEQHMPRGAAKLRKQARTKAAMWPTDRLVDDWRAWLSGLLTAAATLLVCGTAVLVVGSRPGGPGMVWTVAVAACGAGVVYGAAMLKLLVPLAATRWAAGRSNRRRREQDRAEIEAELPA